MKKKETVKNLRKKEKVRRRKQMRSLKMIGLQKAAPIRNMMSTGELTGWPAQKALFV